MTLQKSSLSTVVKSTTMAIIVSLGLTACADTPPPGAYDYRQTHAVTVEREQVSLSFNNDLSSQVISWADVQRLNRFLGDYIQRGRGTVIVEGPNALAAQQTLLTAGLDADEITLMEGVADDVTILTFAAYAMKVPECGDWSASSSLRPDNLPPSNYGCSYHRNLGLMLSDPGDWIQSQPAGTGPLGKSDTAIEGLSSATVAPATDATAATTDTATQ